MQTYDLLMLLVLAGATMFGLWKGMAWQIASIASFVVSYFVALNFSDQLAPTFGEVAPLNKVVAMLAIYIGTSFVIWTLFRLVSSTIDRVKLKEFDRQLGALIGFAKGCLWCIGLTFFSVLLLPQTQRDAIVASQTGKYIVIFLDKSRSIMPPEVHEHLHPIIQRIEKELDPNYVPHGELIQDNLKQQGLDYVKKNFWPETPVQPQANTQQPPQNNTQGSQQNSPNNNSQTWPDENAWPDN